MVTLCENSRRLVGSSTPLGAGVLVGPSMKESLDDKALVQIPIPEHVVAAKRCMNQGGACASKDGWSGDWSGNFNNRVWNNYPQ